VDLRTSEALDIPESSDAVELAKNILQTEPIGVPYYTEAVSYTKHGIPTIICGPGDIDQGHTPNEYITLKQLDAGTEFFKQVIHKTCL
jgi:acetylornithine deacetylase